MLGEINRNLEPIEYEIILCKRDGTQIGVVKDYSDLSYTARFTGVEELSFKVPYYIMDRDFNQVKNPMFDKIKGDFYLLLNGSEYFWIDKPELKGDDKSLTKIIHAYSIEYLLQKKKVRNYTYNSRVLYSFDGEESDGMPLGIMNYLLTLTTWTMGYVDPELTALATRKYRSFDIDDSSFYDVLVMIQSTFDCVIKFDRLNKQFNFYKTDHIGLNRGLYISEDNYIKTFKQTINHDEIITKLYCYGKDNLTFESVNPTGQTYIEDFTFLKTTDYMSQGLINALNNYETLCESHSGEFTGYLTQLTEFQTQLLALQTQLTTLKTEKKVIEDSIDVKIKAKEDYSTLNAQLEAKIVEIAAKEADIATMQSNIDTVNTNITTLKSLLAKANNFTHAQLSELDDCTYEGTWSDTNYITAEDLYEDGLKALADKSSPPLDFTVDVVDFLNVVECQKDWDKLVLGDKVYVHYDEFDVDLEVRLLAYTHQPQSNSLQLTFSSKNTLKNSDLTNIMKQASGTTNTVEMNKEHWKYSYNKTTEIDNVLNNEWDAALRQIVAGSNQDVKITERGIILTDADNPLFQMRILSNVIAISQDGFKTSKLAISPMGVYAEELIGELVASERLIITNEAGNFLVDDLGVTIQNMNLTILTSDNLAKILLNPSSGLKVQKKINNEFVDTFFLDTDGKVNLRDGEIVISDTGNALTATNVWVWNKDGLRFSNNGYNGDYITAMTSDGKIVASFIASGTLASTNSVSWLNLANGTFSFGSDSIAYDGDNLKVKGDIYATNFSADDNIYIVDSATVHSGILWCTSVDAFDASTMPYIWGDCAEPNLDLVAGPSSLLLDSNGTQLGYFTDSLSSYMVADKNSITINYGQGGYIYLDGEKINLGSTRCVSNIYAKEFLTTHIEDEGNVSEIKFHVTSTFSSFYPFSTNLTYLGTSSANWSGLYVDTAPIVASDRNKKHDINYDMSQYEKMFELLKPSCYRMNDGTSNRIHTGFIAQDLEDAMNTTGIDSLNLAAFIKSPRYVQDENGKDTEEIEGYDYAIRYEELIALNTHMIQKMQSKIEELEERLNG